MKELTAFITASLSFLCFVLPPVAHAGRTCEAKKLTPQTLERGFALAEKTLTALNASSDKVVILARAGQDLTKYGLRYSHLGLAYQLPDGQGGHTIQRLPTDDLKNRQPHTAGRAHLLGKCRL